MLFRSSQGLRGTVRADADAALLQLVVALGLEPWAELRHATGPVNDDNTIAVLAASRRGADTQSQDRLRLVATMVMRWLVRAELNPKAAVPVPDFLTVLYGADLNAGVADTGPLWTTVTQNLPGAHGQVGLLDRKSTRLNSSH